MPRRRRYATPAESFAARTVLVGKCLVWTGTQTDKGCGQMRVGKRMVYVHKWAWEQVNGPVPDGMQLDHTCHNEPCANVAHLRVTTRVQNMQNHSGPQSNNTSGVRGVSWHKKRKRWQATTRHEGRQRHVGYFEDVKEAESAVVAKRLELHTHNDWDRTKQTCLL